ncbi:MAG: serine hydrolase domain-containing protein, partial [Sphingopyxis sp.]
DFLANWQAPDRSWRRSMAMLGLGAGGIAAGAWAGPAHALWQQSASHPVLRAYLNEYVSSRRLPGVVAAIGRGDAAPDVIAAGHIATNSMVPADADSLWRIYSMTKPITGMAAMQLVQDGRLTLDQPIYDILPAFRTMRVLTSADAPVDQSVPAQNPITIRHLLTHTAGLGYSIIQSGPIKSYYEAHGIVPAQTTRLSLPGVSRGTPAPSLAAFADAVAAAPLVYQPGTRWSYSIGLDLLGRVIEVVSGMAFDAFLQTRLFDPLGMASTSFTVAPANAARLSTNYAPVGGALLPIDPGATSIYLDQPAFPFGGAGLVSSARDYDRFLHMLLGGGQLNGERVLAPDVAAIAMSNLLPDGVSTVGTMADGAGFGAGGRVSLPGNPGGAGLFGWGGAAGTVGFVHTRHNLRFGAFANYMPSGAYDFQRRTGELMLAEMMTGG